MKLEHKSKDNKTVHDTEQKKQRATIQLSNKMNPHHSLTKKNGGQPSSRFESLKYQSYDLKLEKDIQRITSQQLSQGETNKNITTHIDRFRQTKKIT